MRRKHNLLCLTILILPFLLIRAPAQNSTPGATGLLELPAAEKERILESFEVWKAPPLTRDALPARVVNSQYLPKVGSQGTLGICGSYVIYYYLYSYYFAKARGLAGRPDPVETPQYIFSPAWGVLMSPHGTKPEGDGLHMPEGAWPLRCIESIINIGALTWADMPYSDDAGVAAENKFYRQLATAAQMKNALQYKGLRGSTLNGIDTLEGLQNLKTFLSQGNIAVAIWNTPLTTNFDSYPNPSESVTINGTEIGNVNNNIYAWASEAGGRNPGHAVTIVGYDDNISYRNKSGEECQGALLIVNSWGTTWGIRPEEGIETGFMWLGYEVVLKDKKLNGQVYSIGARTENYQARLLGTVKLQDLTGNNWKTQIMGHPVRWPSLMNTSANGRPLQIDFPSNIYITKSNTPEQDFAEYVFDFSSLADAPFPAPTLQTSLTTPDPVGKIIGLGITRRVQEDNETWTETDSTVPEVDFTVQRFSSSYPTFSATIAMLQERNIGLDDLLPQAGSSAWGDANGDGFPDLAIASIQKKADGTLENIHRVYLNNQNGGFLYPPIAVPVPASQSPRSELSGLLWVDIDNDGDLDLAAGNGDATYIFKNNGQAVFTLFVTLPYPGGPGAIVSADFDLDGRPDLAVAGTSTTGTVILFQTSPGEFTPYPISPRGSNNAGMGVFAPAMAVGDINGDGMPDLIASGRTSGGYQNLIWYQNNGDYTFTPRMLPLPAVPHFSIAIADFDGDRCDDILYSAGSNEGVHLNGVLRGRTEGLPEPAALQGGLAPLWGGRVLWADLNNNGHLEAVISGIENKGLNSSYGYGELDRYPRQPFFKHYTRVLAWDIGEQQFRDTGMTLPSSVGFAGPSILSAVDFDNDGDVDLLSGGVLTSKANFFAAQGPDTNICSMVFLENRARGYFSGDRLNSPPSMPTGLAATAQGNGKVNFNWPAATDDSTPEGALRYLLQAGTNSGQYNLCSGNTAAGLPGQWLKPPVTMRHLPPGNVYWRVRSIDASGMMSAWSSEQSVHVSGSEILPAPAAPLPEVAPPEVTITVKSLDSNGGTAGGYILGGGVVSSGSTILLKAFPRAGWRFSHWEGDVYSPLARKTKMLVYSNAMITARFVPDRSLLHTGTTHTALRDQNGHVWAWRAAFNDARTGPPWLQAQDGLPALSAACSRVAVWLGVNDSRTFFGVSNNQYDNSADNTKNFLRDSLMTVKGLDGFSWWPYPAYPEKTLAMWCGGNSYIANHLGTYTMEYDEITFGGSATSIYPYTSWTVSQHDPNQINLGIAQTALTDSFVLFLTHQATIYAIGSNHCGQLGDNTTNAYSVIAQVPGMPKFKAIAAGWDSGSQTAFALGLDFQGRVWSWGNNDFGQLGLGYHGAGTDVLSPQILPPFSSPVIALAAGNRHALILTEDGQVFAWGDNRQGQIGRGDAIASANGGDGESGQTIVSSPYAVPGLATAFCIAAAASHSMAMTADGQLFGWGNNASGQISGQSSADLWSPTLVPNAPKWQGSASTLTTAVRSGADSPGSNVAYPGMGSVIPPAGLYAARAGSTLQIEAVDGERYQFSHWEGPVADPDNPVTTVLIGADATQVCAVFDQVGELMLTIAANPESAGTTVPEPGVYSLLQNSIHTFRALPKPQYLFKEWTSATVLADKAQQSEFAWEMTNDLNLTAEFDPRPFRTAPKPNIEGSTLSLTEGGQIIWWTQKPGGSAGYTYTKHTLDLGGVRLLDVAGDGLALGSNGRLYAWGSNGFGERGNGTTSSGYNYPDNYNLVLGPDGQDVFSDAVRIFTCGYSRFALRADGSLYFWGKTLLSDQVHTRPRRFDGLKENATLADIACSSGSIWIDDGSLLGKMVPYSAYYFLYGDGTVASWGDPELTGTGQAHDSPTLIPGLNNIRSLAAGSGIVLALRQDGTVLVWGKCSPVNYQGNLGLGANHFIQAVPTMLPGLANITGIFVVNQSCFAVNQQGKLFIWGQNGAWWSMGVGMDGPESYFTPTLHPNANNLPEFVSIAGGGSHMVALTTAGELWKWGRNAYEYNRIQYQQLNWPNAVRDVTFGTYSVTPYTYRRVELSYDPRTNGLVSWPEGVYTLLDGDTITIHAASAPGMSFLEWRKGGVLFSQDPFLEFMVNGDSSLQAVYDIPAPVLELGEIGADQGGAAALPLYLSEAYSNYEAVDLVVRFPDSLRFLGIDSEETQLQDGYMAIFWSIPGQNTRSAQAEVRIIIRQTGELFAAGDIPLAKLRFELPWSDAAFYTVSISSATSPPVLSRNHGAFSDLAALSAGETGRITLNEGAVQEFRKGWLYFTPFGELPYGRLAAWADALALQGIYIGPVVWAWDAARNRWKSSTDLLPNQPLMLFVESGGIKRLELNPAPYSITLRPGWNLLTVPQPLPIPADAVIIFAIGKSSCEIYRQVQLQPGTLYWVFRDADAPVTNYPSF